MTLHATNAQPAKHGSSIWQYYVRSGLRCGLGGSGSTSLVLLHELGGQIESWDNFAALLANDFHLLAYDQRGLSEPEGYRTPADPLTPETHDDSPLLKHVFDLAQLTDDIGLASPQWLVAAAAGAGIAMTYAAHYPHRVAGIVMCAPAVEADDRRRAYLEERAATAIRGGMQAVVDTSLSRSYPPEVRHDFAVFNAYRTRMLAYSAGNYAAANRLLARVDLSSIIPKVRCPCLVLAGRHDVMRTPSELRPFAASLPYGEFAEIDSAHLMAVQTPNELARQVSLFILRHATRESPPSFSSSTNGRSA